LPGSTGCAVAATLNPVAMNIPAIKKARQRRVAPVPIILLLPKESGRSALAASRLKRIPTRTLVLAGAFREPERWHLMCKSSEKGEERGEEGGNMKFSGLGVLLMVGALAGCASSGGPPVAAEEVIEAERALRSAEEAGAEERAPELFEEARIALQAARRASGEEARRRLLEARDYAAAAESMARAERVQREANRIRREADELEQRADQIREDAGRPPR